MKYILLLAGVSMMFNTAMARGDEQHYGQHVTPKQQNVSQEVRDCSMYLYCSQMVSCEQAKYYLSVCKHTARDRDKDGMPCEKTAQTPSFPCPHRIE